MNKRLTTKKYNVPEKPGFLLRVEIPKKFVNKKVNLRVVIINEQILFTDIFNSGVCITETCIYQSLDSDCLSSISSPTEKSSRAKK